MPIKKEIPYSEGLYFITFTCYKWLSLIEFTKGYDIVYNWFDHLKGKGHYINGYVIMPNHLHALIAFRNTGKSINLTVGNGKRFMAYDIINRLKEQHELPLLARLHQAVENSDALRGKRHEVWEDSFDWKECRSEKFINQKLNYMHNNPCKGKWKLVTSPVEYEHSSARFYISGEQGAYPVTNYMELNDINLDRNL